MNTIQPPLHKPTKCFGKTDLVIWIRIEAFCYMVAVGLPHICHQNAGLRRRCPGEGLRSITPKQRQKCLESLLHPEAVVLGRSQSLRSCDWEADLFFEAASWLTSPQWGQQAGTTLWGEGHLTQTSVCWGHPVLLHKAFLNCFLNFILDVLSYNRQKLYIFKVMFWYEYTLSIKLTNTSITSHGYHLCACVENIYDLLSAHFRCPVQCR